MVCGVTQFSGILPDDLNLGLHWNHITVHVYCTCLSFQIPLHVIQNLHSKAFIIRSLILIKHSNLYLLAMRVVHKSLHNKNVFTIQIIDWSNLSLLLTKGRGREVGGWVGSQEMWKKNVVEFTFQITSDGSGFVCDLLWNKQLSRTKVYVVVQFYRWFKILFFIVSNALSYITIPKNNRKITFTPRINLNHKIY